MAEQWTEEDHEKYQQEIARALAEGRKPNLPKGKPVWDEKRKARINKLPVRYS
tara:strand:+ start:728 stop:886 length:159 start_codon:yes stop_codon:yes gene_type:complete